ncbi:MAG: alpha/beta hydrolase family protein [Planctomycetia bacterium]|nr:alpha/beta hydrolase family protein [Planctomycetia bacterium]
MIARTVCRFLLAMLAVGSSQAAPSAEVRTSRTGSVEYQPAPNEATLPKQFQLERHTFQFQQTDVPTSSRRMRISSVTFPSPVTTPERNNNTVHCEYFCPTQVGKKPGVVVLHILGGDFDLSRLFCRALASNGVAGLFMIMPHYGPRQQPGSSARMISIDPRETVRGMTQAVLDVRQAAAWLAGQDEIDPKQLGVMGISLGGITSALVASLEPRFTKACFILAGGDMGEVAWTSTELAPVREHWKKTGGNKESLFAELKVIDPVTYARPLAGRKILMLNARQDEVVPPACTESLWRAFGQPEIVWWDAGHYTAVRYIFEAMAKTVRFFQPSEPRPGEDQSTAK